jgi:heme/copper-type cytochrome/quinol oxidase subunit 2
MKSEKLINTAIIIFVALVVGVVIIVVLRSFVMKYRARKQKVKDIHGNEEVEIMNKN